MKYGKILIQVGIVVVTILVARVLFPENAVLGNQGVPTADHKVVIIPMAGLPSVFVSKLKKELEKQHGFPVLVTTELGKGPEMIMKESGQYHSGHLAFVGNDIAKRIDRANAFKIVLTNEDINDPDSGLRFYYSAHFDGLSVVSLARINPSNFGVLPNLIEIPEMYMKMTSRALKLINKSIGYGVYAYQASSDVNSVMYGPVMGLSDLDRVGDWY